MPLSSPAALRIPDQLARPLGRGAHDLASAIGLFTLPAPDAPGANPNLQRSLERFAQLPELGPRLRRLPVRPAVLIQGYSDPGNAGALRGFLRAQAGLEPRVEAIDLYDLPAVYQLLGFPPPDFGFRVADASDLRSHHAAGTVDVVVQDFLLNCAPPALHAPILREVARILSADGVAFISFSDRSGVSTRPTMDAAGFQRRFGVPWRADAYDLADVFPAGPFAADLNGLGGSVVHDPETKTATLTTEPTGRFEFFRDAEVMLGLFEQAGLTRLAMDRSEGVDSHGLRCARHRCLLGRAA